MMTDCDKQCWKIKSIKRLVAPINDTREIIFWPFAELKITHWEHSKTHYLICLISIDFTIDYNKQCWWD